MILGGRFARNIKAEFPEVVGIESYTQNTHNWSIGCKLRLRDKRFLIVEVFPFVDSIWRDSPDDILMSGLEKTRDELYRFLNIPAFDRRYRESHRTLYR